MTPPTFAPSDIAALALAALVAVGLLQCVLGWAALHRFRQRTPQIPATLPPVTILKPLHGDEPLLEQALATNFQQDYPTFQLVFGLHDANDPALAVLHRLQARFPHIPVDIVIDRTMHGANRKISNLINMFPRAQHDTLVIADSDMHVAPDYLRRLVAAMQPGPGPRVGLVTTLYSALPATPTLAGILGASQVNHAFLPGALMSRSLGRQDCLGATMALTRQRLESCGGLQALKDHLADDAVLGRLVLQQGLKVSLAATIPATTIPETTLQALFQHELRWARTVKSLEPTGFVFGAAQYPLAWAALALCITAAAPWACWLFAAAWALRAAIATASDRPLGLASIRTLLCLPFRDLMSVAVMLASYRTRRVDWRGQSMIASRPQLAPGEG